MCSRLSSIEELIKRIPNLAPQIAPVSQTNNDAPEREVGQSSSPSDSRSEGQADDEDVGDEDTFDGDITTNAQSALARQVFEKAVSNSPIMGQAPELHDALSSLRNMTFKIKDNPSLVELPRQRLTADVHAKYPLPSLAEMYSLLDNADCKYSSSQVSSNCKKLC